MLFFLFWSILCFFTLCRGLITKWFSTLKRDWKKLYSYLTNDISELWDYFKLGSSGGVVILHSSHSRSCHLICWLYSDIWEAAIRCFYIEIASCHLLLLRVTLNFTVWHGLAFVLFGFRIPMSIQYRVQVITVYKWRSALLPRSDQTFSCFPIKIQRNALQRYFV